MAIARALVTKPAIILADEPTGNLDTKSSEIIMSELRDIHQQGNTIIMVTHNPDVAVYADRVIQMVDGTVASDSKHPITKDDTKKRPLNTFRKAMDAAALANREFADATAALIPPKPPAKRRAAAAKRRKVVKRRAKK